VWFRKAKQDRAAVSRDLRERIFAIMPGEFGIAPGPGHERVWAVLVETGYPQAVASLITVADGTTSLYFSNGGPAEADERDLGEGRHPLCPLFFAGHAVIAAVRKVSPPE
jgi:hypothetical protein